MRILHVIPSIDPRGGAERSLAASARQLCERAELHVVTFESGEGLAVEIRAAGAVVHRATSPRRLGRVTVGWGCLTLVPVDDSAAMAQAVCGILTGELNPDLSAGRRRFLEQYSIELEAERMLDLYERVIRTSRPARSD